MSWTPCWPRRRKRPKRRSSTRWSLPEQCRESTTTLFTLYLTSGSAKSCENTIDCWGIESGVRSQESGVRSQESGVRSQESGVRSQESGVRSQESGCRLVRKLQAFYFRVVVPGILNSATPATPELLQLLQLLSPVLLTVLHFGSRDW